MKKTSFEAIAVYLMLGFILIVLMVMYLRLDNSIKKTAENLLDNKNEFVEEQLDHFFEPIHTRLHEEWLRGKTGAFNDYDIKDFVKHFSLVIKPNPSIYATYVSDINGNHKFLRRTRDTEAQKKRTWLTNESTHGSEQYSHSENNTWFYNFDSLVHDSTWRAETDYDPRTRGWFNQAINSDTTICTQPYPFSGFSMLGITFSRAFMDETGIKKTVSFDVTLGSLSELTSQLKVSENGKAFIFTDSSLLVGIPSFKGEFNADSVSKYSLTKIEDFSQKDVAESYKSWCKQDKTEKTFSFSFSSSNSWTKITPYSIHNANFYLGIVVPEDDIIGPIKQTKYLLLLGMIFIMVFALILVQVYRNKRKANSLLSLQKNEIEQQSLVLQEKNHEILDSITYAKRIQKAILPTDDFWFHELKNSFVWYEPKDIIAGDFYWMIEHEGLLLFAAADCTGHGVPGAMVSVVCNNALNRSVKEFGLVDPGKILDKTRELVINEFEKSEDDVKDGMDIALICLDKKTNEVDYAGAHNSLWVIRKGTSEIEEYKANKQPIGTFAKPEPFKTHKVQLGTEDQFYIFSDGFADQFGGEKGKKFKSSNFKKLLIQNKDLDISLQKERLIQTFIDWKGDLDQLDDVCVIGVRV